MSAKEKLWTIPITNTTLTNTLEKILENPDSDMITLFEGLLSESPKGVEYFFKIVLGEVLPEIPQPGTEVYIQIDKLGWSVKKEDYQNTHYNENGYIKGTVINFRGFHQYSPIVVQLPPLQPNTDPESVYVDFTDIFSNDIDPYDKEPCSF